MFKISGLLCLVVTFVLGAILFSTSQSVQDLERDLEAKNEALSIEQEAYRVLDTEWDYLNRPQRLEHLARQGLGMQTPAVVDEKGRDAPVVDDNAIGIVSDIRNIPEPLAPVIPAIKPASFNEIMPAAPGRTSSEGAPKDEAQIHAPDNGGLLTLEDIKKRKEAAQGFDALMESVEREWAE